MLMFMIKILPSSYKYSCYVTIILIIQFYSAFLQFNKNFLFPDFSVFLYNNIAKNCNKE